MSKHLYDKSLCYKQLSCLSNFGLRLIGNLEACLLRFDSCALIFIG